MHTLMQALPAYDQKAIFDVVLRDLALRFLQSGTDALEKMEFPTMDTTMISAAAALVNGLVQNNPLLETHVIQFLTTTSGEYAGIGIGVRRAVIATLATSQGTVCHCARLEPANFEQTNSSKFLRNHWRHLGTRYKSSTGLSFSRSVSESCHTSCSHVLSSCVRVEPVLTCALLFSNRSDDPSSSWLPKSHALERGRANGQVR